MSKPVVLTDASFEQSVEKGKGVTLVDDEGKPVTIDARGFDHFAAS